jgi:type I restriction enzyme S subunit
MVHWRKYLMTRKMKDSGVEWIGEIPEDWEKKKLKNIARFRNGLAHEKNIDMDGKYIVVNSKFVSTEGKVRIYSNELIMKLNLNDVCIVMSDVPNGRAFAKCYIIEEDNKYTLNQRVGCFYDVSINLKYFYYYLNRNNGLLLFDDGINQTNLRKPDLLNLTFLIPSHKEQEKIANYLDKKCNKIDETIEKEKAAIEKLKEYKQSIITEAVTKGLNPDVPTKDSGVEWIGEIPEHWSIRRLRYLGNCQNGISKSSEYFGKGYPFVSYGDVYRNIELPKVVNGLVESTESDRKTYSVEQGDIFFTRTSETIEEIGLTCICTKTIENATFAGFLIRVRPTNKERLNIGYSKYYFSSNMHRRFFVKEMNLVTRASLSQELLKKLPVLLPPIEEQQEIADYLDKKCSAIDKLISNKEKVIEKLTIYKKSLIYECVTGKREIQ